MVTVRSATTQRLGTAPVCADRPLGTSTATTRAPEELRQSIQMSKGARSSPSNPVPSMQSSTTSAFSSSASSSGREGPTMMGTPALTADWATTRARSPRRSSGAIGVTTWTARPLALSVSAATQPSPPLLPMPVSTTTVSESGSERTSCAAA